MTRHAKKVTSKNSLAIRYPEIAKQWHPIFNDNFKATAITYGSHRKVWWLCPVCSNSWQAQPNTRTHSIQNKGCPFCAGQKVDSKKSLKYLHNSLLKEWDYTRNTIKPEDVLATSHKSAYWVCCSNKTHMWYASIRTRVKGARCPFCSGKRLTYEKSLEYNFPELAKEWSSTNKLKASEVFWSAGIKGLWICSKGHKYDMRINDRTSLHKANCPFCSGRRACNDNCLTTLAPEIAKEWHPTKNGVLTPNDVTCGSGKRVWWLCPKNHSYIMAVTGRTGQLCGCPKCHKKTEQRVREIFERHFKRAFSTKRPKWLININTGNRLELDGYSEELKIAFEYDGEFHERPHPKSKNKDMFMSTQNDNFKDSLCKEKGISLIRINYNQTDNLEEIIMSKIKAL